MDAITTYHSLFAATSVIDATMSSFKLTPDNFNYLAGKAATVTFFALDCISSFSSYIEFRVLFNAVTYLTPEIEYVFTLLGSAAIAFSFYAVVKLINSYTSDKFKSLHFKTPNDPFVEFEKPLYIETRQTSILMRLAMTTLLVAFGAMNPIIGAINLVSLSFSFYKLSKRNWLSISEYFFHPKIVGNLDGRPWTQIIESIKTVLYFPLISANKKTRDDCTICLEGSNESEPKPDFYFCKNHVFHLSCIIDLITSESKKLLNNFKIERYTRHYRDNIHTGTSLAVSGPLKNLPKCPNCRLGPIFQGLEMSITERNIPSQKFGGTHTAFLVS